jgi:hypothetical protein
MCFVFHAAAKTRGHVQDGEKLSRGKAKSRKRQLLAILPWLGVVTEV